MSKYRNNLPQLSNNLFLTDGGLETTLIFHHDLELPEFAAFDLFKNKQGKQILREYFERYAKLAQQKKAGFILESPTWRASIDWGKKIGYTQSSLKKINKESIELLESIRNKYETTESPMSISACIGPRDDGYNPTDFMSINEATAYHETQINTFKNTAADFISAITMTYVEEAIGIVNAASYAGLPVVISFTVETDGHLPSGQTLKEAIEQVDRVTNNAPVYYMINCAHPTHFSSVLSDNQPWLQRIKGIRANASCKSHAELDEAIELDDGNPTELGYQYSDFKSRLKNLNVVGGCCGTDHRHIEAICNAWQANA